MHTDRLSRITGGMAGFIRTGVYPEGFPENWRPGLTLYRTLTRSILSDMVDTAFPICKRRIPETVWNDLTDSFIRSCPLPSPRLWEIAGNFADFHRDEQSGLRLGFPWLDDCLKMEWLELELFNRPDLPGWTYKAPTGRAGEKVSLVPDHDLLVLNYPVFRMTGPDPEPETCFLLLFRDPVSLTVQFIELQPVGALAAESLRTEPGSCEDIANRISVSAGLSPDRDAMIQLFDLFRSKNLLTRISKEKQ